MTDAILYWNQVALDAAKEDYSTADPVKDPPQQRGPTLTSRALAIVHLAMYDAYVGITGGPTYLSYATTPGTNHLTAAQTAVAAAAYLTLQTLFSRQKGTFLKEFKKFIAMLPDHNPKIDKGIAWGTLVAEEMLANRKDDGSKDCCSYVSDSFYAPNPEPGRHRPDPMDPGQDFLDPLWGKVKPFGFIDIGSLHVQVPDKAPPALNSLEYATDFDEVLNLGRSQGSTRTNAQTTAGLFWAYDGARNIGTPPRLYNQVIRSIANKKGATEAENAKLFAMVNVAMADAGIKSWHEKYKYNIWRPVVGIREADADWGPTGLGDGNSIRKAGGDPYWIPLGAPPTNQPAKTAGTPNFPAYPSGHATFGTAALRIAALVLKLPDSFEFSFISDELDGESIGSTGVRTKYERKLTIATAIEENVCSRVYLGVHWRFDAEEGKRVGEEIAVKIAAAFPKMA